MRRALAGGTDHEGGVEGLLLLLGTGRGGRRECRGQAVLPRSHRYEKTTHMHSQHPQPLKGPDAARPFEKPQRYLKLTARRRRGSLPGAAGSKPGGGIRAGMAS